MAKNKIDDLRDHLFAQLERLGDEDLVSKEGELEREIERAKAINNLSATLINSAKVETDRVNAVHRLGKYAGSNLLRDQEKQALGIENRRALPAAGKK